MKFTGKNYKEYLDSIVKFKDIKTKYPLLELALSSINGDVIKPVGLGYKTKFDLYYNYRVLSMCDYDDTKTTSIILHDKRMDKDDQIHSDTYS